MLTIPYAETFFQYAGECKAVFPIIEPYVNIDDLDIDYLTAASSLKNLDRLGLIRFVDVNMSGNDSTMEALLNSDILNNYYQMQDYLKEHNLRSQDGDLQLKTGNVFLTTLGSRFSKVCL